MGDKANGWSAAVLTEAFEPCRVFVRRVDVGERTLRTTFDENGAIRRVAGVDDVALRTTRLGRCLVERACALPARVGSSRRAADLAVVTTTKPPSFHGHVEVTQASWTPAGRSPKDEPARLERLRLAYASAARRCVEERPSDYPYLFSMETQVKKSGESFSGGTIGLGKLASAVIGCIEEATRGLGVKAGLTGTVAYDVSVGTQPR